MRWLSLVLTSLLLLCTENKDESIADNRILPDVVFKVNITFDRKAYHYTNFGEPPQTAIWLENPDRTKYIPVWVSHRSAYNDWKGKIECTVALPYWDQRKQFSFEKLPVDAYSGATPLNDSLSVAFTKNLTGKWFYFIEVNTSADYNKTFSYWSDSNYPDSEGNGQPSLIYKGEIDFDKKAAQGAVIIGRSIQFGTADSLISDLTGISTAKKLIKGISVVF